MRILAIVLGGLVGLFIGYLLISSVGFQPCLGQSAFSQNCSEFGQGIAEGIMAEFLAISIGGAACYTIDELISKYQHESEKRLRRIIKEESQK
jgi:hypothetical protein